MSDLQRLDKCIIELNRSCASFAALAMRIHISAELWGDICRRSSIETDELIKNSEELLDRHRKRMEERRLTIKELI